MSEIKEALRHQIEMKTILTKKKLYSQVEVSRNIERRLYLKYIFNEKMGLFFITEQDVAYPYIIQING